MTQLLGISLVGWHLFQKADLRFSGNSAILGKNATGKSTLIDLIQAVMTGGSGSLYKFNRSAAEGGGRSERTLLSYCLGQTDEGERVRDGGVTHLALIFGGGRLARPVTLGLCIEVVPGRNEAHLVGRYVADGVDVGTGDLLAVEGGREKPRAYSEIRPRLMAACKEAGGAFLEHGPGSAARMFIREYMKVLFTGRRAVDPERFIKAFIMALSFEDMKSVEEFVRSYLFEKDDIKVLDLRESIQRYQQIQKEIAELERRLATLKPILLQIEAYRTTVDEEAVTQQLHRLGVLLQSWSEHSANLFERRAKREEIERLQAEIERLQKDLEFAEGEEESIRAQIDASGFESQRHGLRQDIRSVEAERDRLIQRLQLRFVATSRAVELVKLREKLQNLSLGLGPLLNELIAIEEAGRGQSPPAWPSDPSEMERLLTGARTLAQERLTKVAQKRDETTALRVGSEAQSTELAKRLADSREGRVRLDPKTIALMEMLREVGFRPRAVCQVIDVADESWRDAAEALLGRDRETIIVDPEHAEDAVSLYRRERHRFFGCRVANTRKLVNSPVVGEPGSLAATLSGGDPIAMAFVVYRLGNVKLAQTQPELLSGGRAVMRDVTYYDGLTVEVRRAPDLKIGRVAAAMMGEVIRKELADQEQITGTHRRTEQMLIDVYQRLELLSVVPPNDHMLGAITAELADVDTRRADLLERLERVGMLVDPKLREAQARVTATIKSLREDLTTALPKSGELKGDLKGIDQRVAAGTFNVSSHRRLLRERVPSSVILGALKARYRQGRGSTRHGRYADQMQEATNRLGEKRQGQDVAIRDAIADYLLGFSIQRPFESGVPVLPDLKDYVVDSIDLLESNDLVRYRRQADEAAERVTFLFRSSFVHELNRRFSGLERDIEDLRAALRSKTLHGEIYSLHAHVQPEFRALYELARASETDEQVLSALFNTDVADHPHAEAIAAVEDLLRNESADFERYQDYRNYFSFELRMRNVETGHETNYDRRRGVASGAERQTPFYVIIGAALASIYHGTRRADAEARGIGLAVFDEAFSKLDGQNQRTMLEFYNEIGLQVVIAAPTEKRAVVYENLDSVIDVYKFGRFAEAEASRIKLHAREAMREANPDHLTDAQLLERLALPDTSSAGRFDDDETVH